MVAQCCFVDNWYGSIVGFFKFCLLPALLLGSSQAHACPVANKSIRLSANGHALIAEVATTRASMRCGLAFRDALPADHGMLFVYAQDQIVGFWMKNTTIPLSIAFLDSDGKIMELHDMDPQNPARRYISRLPVRFALEVNQGWFSEKGIEVGDRVDLDLLSNGS
ncbi:MAG: DUF192 domain-containing protein [Gammaproteobacteria bacterium]